MFKIHKNYTEANTLLKIFEQLFKYSKYTEDNGNASMNSSSTKYTASFQNNWNFIIEFSGKQYSGVFKKKFYPTIVFKKEPVFNKSSPISEINEQSKIIADFIQNTYNPDFEKMMNVINIFNEIGLNYGLFNKVDIQKYKKHISSHMHTSKYYGEIELGNKNHSVITFNNVLQNQVKKGFSNNERHFKKSFVSVHMIYLVNTNKEVDLYFKIQLPKSPTKKLTYIIPITNADKMYLVTDDESLRQTPIDKIISMPLNNETLTKHFQEEIQNEIKNSISTALKIKKEDLNNLSNEELKEYFVLVEMIKI